MSKHTPGPWIIPKGRSKRDGAIRSASGCYICEVMPIEIKEYNLELLDLYDEQQQANKALITSAPDLLEACKALVAYHDRGNWADNRLTDHLKAARAAIEKAEGE